MCGKDRGHASTNNVKGRIDMHYVRILCCGMLKQPIPCMASASTRVEAHHGMIIFLKDVPQKAFKYQEMR